VAHPAATESANLVYATKYREKCDTGESCLFVNVFRQTGHDPEKKLPVAVYIHGGGFLGGSGDNVPLSNMLAWSKEPFIGVTFNYRLGALGFLPSKATSAENVLNLGLKDQLMLLRWVQANIGAFGGDPGNVTLMGSSAGAHSVSLLLATTRDES
jgi:acetylcholinesterase